MLDALKTLFENDVVSAEVRQEIEEAWTKKIKENRLEVTAELREEFAQKYAHDKTTMAEAVDKMVDDRLTTEINELKERNTVLEERVDGLESKNAGLEGEVTDLKDENASLKKQIEILKADKDVNAVNAL